jgi:4-carboxymuconolactone decarboxylase
MDEGAAAEAYRSVMTVEPRPPNTPFERATRDFVFGNVWSRPGLSRKNRRWVTLTCVAAADSPEPIDAHVYAALNSGDIELEEMLEFVLHFAVYCGWPKASHLEMVITRQWKRIEQERGEEERPWPVLDNDTLGPNDWEARLELGAKEFADVNHVPAPSAETPYRHAGILNFVFGHVWQRPGLSRRDRRFITVPCVGVAEAPMPILSHVGSALHSGDVTRAEMDELILQFTAYSGTARGGVLKKAVEDDLLGNVLAAR